MEAVSGLDRGREDATSLRCYVCEMVAVEPLTSVLPCVGWALTLQQAEHGESRLCSMLLGTQAWDTAG